MLHIKKELRKFILFWGSQAVSSLGSGMTEYALILWVLGKTESVLAVSVLTVCSMLPGILIGMFTGVIVDRMPKKKLILICDTFQAFGTILICLLMASGSLEIWHIYVINLCMGAAGAFQSPAAQVFISEIVPEEEYQRISGLLGLSGSVVGIVTPALAAAVTELAGIEKVFLFDIGSFAFAFLVLLLLIKEPDYTQNRVRERQKYWTEFREGIHFFQKNQELLLLILYFTAINLVAFVGGGGITTTVAVMVKRRVKNGEVILGMISTAVSLGTLVGGILVTAGKEPKSRVKIIFVSCALTFLLCDWPMALSRIPAVWIGMNFIGNIPIAFMDANQSVILRKRVPLEMQGRVFAVRNTFQCATMPLSYLLGGILGDYIFEPWMRKKTFIVNMLSKVIGNGKGSGIAAMFLCTGFLGIVLSLAALKDKRIRKLD